MKATWSRRLILAGFAALLCAPAASAQNYPQQAVTMIVPFPPGGGTDTGARLLAQKLSEKWGQQVIVDNKPGAAGIVGLEIASKAKPDGYTIVMGNIGTQAINPSLYKKLPYNADAAFTPITLVAELPLVLVVNPSTDAKTTADLIALAKAKPGEFTYSTSGNGSSMHLAAALFENQAGLKLTHVPYKGGGPAIQDLIGGHVRLSFATVLETSGQIKAGKLKPIAVTSDKRSPALPDVPTAAESGLPGYNSISWIGLLAPTGTPQPIVDKIAADVHAVLTEPATRQQFVDQGAIPVGSTPAQFKALIDTDRARYGKIIVEKDIKLE
ncbi:MAG: tripartite tricarboxylate transporter substrate binding protein [Alphaproteobacteria bacterium]|jgi:tripartite-type tricarboxylate transporter receptor subunit TctC|nr:tripartite tricarboxylate transporter substrate binding protein [Alphaproteobacteria bacterium]